MSKNAALKSVPDEALPLGEILVGDSVQKMKTLPEASVDLVFADPPYNLQLSQELWRPNMTKVDAVDDAWDHFQNFESYDAFSGAWLEQARRVLKPDGALWVIGTYHNIFRIGRQLQDMGFWIMNDVLWIKTNPMPNFRGVRLANAHETLIWAARSKKSKATFNHHAMKELNGGKQMRSDWWEISLCTGSERLKVNGQKAHPTQKPEALLYRVILSSTHPGDVVLDPFFGTGTTGAVAKRLHRQWIGIEKEANYIEIAQKRLDEVTPELFQDEVFDVRDKRRLAPRIAFTVLLEHGLIQPGQILYFRRDPKKAAYVRPDGKLVCGEVVGSIHQVGSHLTNGSPCNGWDHWYYESKTGELNTIDTLRKRARVSLNDGVDKKTVL